MKSKSSIFTQIAIASLFVIMCNTNLVAQTAIKKTATIVKPTTAEIEEGKILISKSDCLACHKLDIKLIGPSYKDVATKYPATEANYNLLSQKIIKGGAGVWGTMPMSPHATLKVDDARKMVKYILSIK